MELFEQYDEEEVRKVLRDEALEEGLEQGIGIGLRNVAQNMKMKGFDEETIILATGLTKEDLREF